MNVVNVVVTCTKDKRYPIADDCQIRNIPNGTLADRINEWQDRLNRRFCERVIVNDLYSGDHWANVRAFSSACFDIDLWVCSAGLGLIRVDDKVPPYAATFSRNHPDSVSDSFSESERSTATKDWWNAIQNCWKSWFNDRPRSLSMLMARYPKRSLLVVTSETYLQAIADDLRQGVSCLFDPDQLSVVCSGVKTLKGLEANLIPCDARMQALTGGVRRSLNTRLANRILCESRLPPRASALIEPYQKLLDQQPPIKTYNREQITDGFVMQYIRQHLKEDCSKRHTPLLRLLRNQNFACEQNRFVCLFNKVKEELSG